MQKRGKIFASTKAQITIFMILGLVVVFIFIFLVQLKTQTATRSLERSKEDIVLKSVQQEALRVFVEDCLWDGAEQGIILLGKQGGRIWDDQPGGSQQFIEGVTGVYDPGTGNRVAYGLLHDSMLYETSSHQAYPCATLENPSLYCKYGYPDTEARFGVPRYLGVSEHWKTQIEKDLENYLTVQARACIDGFFQKTFPGTHAEAEPEAFHLSVRMEDDGVWVDAFYPLRFGFEGKSYVSLSTFDFLYPSGLKKFLRAAFFFPMEMDWRYVDFHYTDDTLRSDSFTASGVTRTTFKADYNALGASLTEAKELPVSGDTLFTFTAPFPQVVNAPGDYVFTVARQNRPPALDYVHRQECLTGDPGKQYDFLVVKGATGDLGSINYQLQARDPDKETSGTSAPNPEQEEGATGISYGIDTGSDLTTLQFTLPKTVLLSSEDVNSLIDINLPKIYHFTAKAKDSYGLEDKQEVRVLVDNAIDPEAAKVLIKLPWGDAVADADGSGKLVISKEDPFIITAQAPTGTEYGTGILRSIKLNGAPIFTPTSGQTCWNLPKDNSECFFSLADYSSTSPAVGFPPVDGSSHQKILNGGELEVEFAVNYCSGATGGGTEVTSVKNIPFVVKECIAHVNTENDYPYIPGTEFYKFKYDDYQKLVKDRTTSDYVENPITPYAASHTCCNENGRIKGGTCKGPPNCAQVPDGWTDASTGYLVVENVGTCTKGNFCNANPPSLVKESGTEVLKCGDPEKDISCDASKIATQCKGKKAWDYVNMDSDPDPEFFCMGTMGCSQSCDLSTYHVIVKGVDSKLSDYAKDSKLTGNTNSGSTVEIKCIASSSCLSGFKTDTNHDGIFAEACS